MKFTGGDNINQCKKCTLVSVYTIVVDYNIHISKGGKQNQISKNRDQQFSKSTITKTIENENHFQPRSHYKQKSPPTKKMKLTKTEANRKTTLTFYPIKKVALGKMIISQTELLQVLEIHNTTTNELLNKESKTTEKNWAADLAENLIGQGFENDPTENPAQLIFK